MGVALPLSPGDMGREFQRGRNSCLRNALYMFRQFEDSGNPLMTSNALSRTFCPRQQASAIHVASHLTSQLLLSVCKHF